MAATTTMLLMLTVMVGPVYLQQNCSVEHITDSSGNFTLIVAPATYTVNTNYTVTVTGTGNVTYVRFQASEKGINPTDSSWITDNVTNTCPNSSDIYINGPVPLVAHWKSSNGTSATIRAFITVNSNTTYTVFHDLKNASTTTPMPQLGPTVNATNASNTAITVSTVKTTVINATTASNPTSVNSSMGNTTVSNTTTTSNPTSVNVSMSNTTVTNTTTASNPTSVNVSMGNATVTNTTTARNPTTVANSTVKTTVPTSVSTVKTTVINATKSSNETTVTVSTVKATSSANSASYSSWILIAPLLSAYMAVKNRVMC
ncbi:uncharacterized protein LOC144823665 [Lissotriton helveticus]